MDTSQLIERLARAVEMANPAQEYCFLGIQHWSMCMTKAEWSGWMQAIGAVIAIIFSGRFVALQIKESRRVAREIFDRRIGSFSEIFETAYEISIEALNHSSNFNNAVGYCDNVYDRRTFEDVNDALSEMRIEQFESANGVKALLIMRRNVVKAERLVLASSDGENVPWDEQETSETEEYINGIRRELDRGINLFRSMRLSPKGINNGGN